MASDGVRATKIFAGFQRPVVEASRGLSQVAERISSSSTTRNVALAGSVVAAGILVKGAVDEANSLAPESAEKRAVDPPQPPKIHNFTTAAPAGAPSATIPISQGETI